MAQMLRDARIVSAEDGRWIGERFEDVLQGAVLRAQKADLIAIRSQWMEGNRDFEVTAVMAIFSESGSAEHPPDRRLSIQVMRDLQERAKLYGLPLHWMFPRQAQAAARRHARLRACHGCHPRRSGLWHSARARELCV